MTENEWQNASEPHAMLEFLRISERTSKRKLRLFAVACCVSGAGLTPSVGTAVEVAEDFADGLAGPQDLRLPGLPVKGREVRRLGMLPPPIPQLLLEMPLGVPRAALP